jgi:hypothetical protein
MKNIETLDIVEEVLNGLNKEKALELLRSAISVQLAKSISDRRMTQLEPMEVVEKLVHKAQSLMSPVKALEFSEMLLRDYNIDARLRKTSQGPREKVGDFLARVRFEKYI